MARRPRGRADFLLVIAITVFLAAVGYALFSAISALISRVVFGTSQASGRLSPPPPVLFAHEMRRQRDVAAIRRQEAKVAVQRSERLVQESSAKLAALNEQVERARAAIAEAKRLKRCA